MEHDVPSGIFVAYEKDRSENVLVFSFVEIRKAKREEQGMEDDP